MRTDPIRIRTAAALAAVGGFVTLFVAMTTLLTGPAGAEPSSDPTETSPTVTPTLEPSPTELTSPTEEPTPTDEPSSTPPTPTPTPTPSPTSEPETEVDDAVLRWGINNESNNRAFAPDTFNFFSAGRVPDPGEGGQRLQRSDWRPSAGSVAIQKWDGESWRPATWAGLGTDATGAALGSPTAGTFSGHNIVLSGGHGSVDAAGGDARIEWDGDVTVLYYSGMSFFYVADPVLVVEDGVGTLTARVSGFGSSIDDPTAWEPVAARRVTIADLPDVDLGAARGFVARPAYRGVRVTGVPQDVDGADMGAFPQSYVDYMDRLGTAAFWYSSGAATDPFKVPLPLSISYDASRTVDSPMPTAAPSQERIDNPTVASPPAPGLMAPPAPMAAPPAPVPSAAEPFALAPRPMTELRLAAAEPAVVEPAERSPWLWWAGGGLLLLASLLLLLPAGRPAPH